MQSEHYRVPSTVQGALQRGPRFTLTARQQGKCLFRGLRGQGGSDGECAVQPQTRHSSGVMFPFTFVCIGSPYYCL